jgi:hypothetical protein
MRSRPLERLALATRILSCSEALRQETGAQEGWISALNDETRAAARAGLDEAVFAEEWERGWTLTADDAVALALDSLEPNRS